MKFLFQIIKTYVMLYFFLVALLQQDSYMTKLYVEWSFEMLKLNIAHSEQGSVQQAKNCITRQ